MSFHYFLRLLTSVRCETGNRFLAALLSSISWNSVWKNSIELLIICTTTVLLIALLSTKSSKSMISLVAAQAATRSMTRSRSFSSAKSLKCIRFGSLRSDCGKMWTFGLLWMVVDSRREIDNAQRSQANSLSFIRETGVPSRFICKRVGTFRA